MLGLTIVGALFAFASLCATGANDVANALGVGAPPCTGQPAPTSPLTRAQAPLWAAKP